MAWNGSAADFDAFVDRHGLSFGSIDDSAGVVYERFGIPTQPAFALVDATGSVETLLGAADDAVLDMLIGNLVSS